MPLMSPQPLATTTLPSVSMVLTIPCTSSQSEMSVFMSVPLCFDSCIFVASFEIRKYESSNLFFSFRIFWLF